MLRYIGKAFIVGVPARDLTDEEVKKFGEKKLLSTGLYEKVRVKKNFKETVKQADVDSAEVKDGWN